MCAVLKLWLALVDCVILTGHRMKEMHAGFARYVLKRSGARPMLYTMSKLPFRLFVCERSIDLHDQVNLANYRARYPAELRGHAIVG